MTVVLITGTSSGIGRASALRLAGRGMTVYATARSVAALSDLADAGCRVLPLDVNDESSMRAAVDQIVAEHGAIDVLINNAGYGEYGTIEETDLDRVRAQFDTNVFGLARLTQLVLPAMRRAGHGRVINVGSMGGRIVFPAGGYYHASKYAVEAITDALRFEVAPFGIAVSLIEPGLIRTGFGAAAERTLTGSGARSDAYAGLNEAARKVMADSYGSRVLSATADTVARAIEHAATTRRPRTRYVVTAPAKAIVHMRRLFGARVFDSYLRTQFRTA